MKLRMMVEIESDLSLMFPEVSDADVLAADPGLCTPEMLVLHAESIRQDLVEQNDAEGTVAVRVLSAVLV